jgi:exodeoxyribonuclease-3
MRIYSWNVNGLRSVLKKRFRAWARKADGDIIGLQETRVRREQLPKRFPKDIRYHLDLVEAERKGYSGVGLLSREEPDEVTHSLGRDEFDVEGRYQMARFGELTVVNAYFPNGSGKNRDHSRIPYKLAFYDHLRELLQARVDAGEQILVMGDFNTSFAEIDLARPKQNKKTSGFCPEERASLGEWFGAGWVDTYRVLHPDKVEYSWWSQRYGVREKNIGWRIDYILASPAAFERVESATIHTDIKGSDHCPISVVLR